MWRLAWVPIAVLISACAGTGNISPIDYSLSPSWLERPDHDTVGHSPANLVPRDSGHHVLGMSARADVFYIHPTTGMRNDVENVPIDDAHALATGQLMLMSQATPFNSVARIYAPRYRQATLNVFDRTEDALQEPMNLAYEDVRHAFIHYMTHLNQGRPYFLVGHSQGSNHGLRLLSDEIQGSPFEAALIAAYLPGMPTPCDVFDQDLTRILPCTSAEQVRCVVTWGVFEQGYRDFADWESMNIYWDASAMRWRSAQGMRLFNVNPVSWEADGAPVSRDKHQGAVPFGVSDSHFSRPLPRLVTSWTEHGYTLVAPSLPDRLFYDGGIFERGNYHVFDINLFWTDIRTNARQRLVAFLMQQASDQHLLIRGAAMVTAHVNREFRVPLTLHNGPARFYAQGLPPGGHIDAASGVISGTPVASGYYPVLVTAHRGDQTDRMEVILVVQEPDHESDRM